MGQTNFEKLDIYRLSETLSDGIWDVVAKWNHLAQDTVGKQIVRSADSVGANIAEGSGRGTDISELTPKLNAYIRAVKGPTPEEE